MEAPVCAKQLGLQQTQLMMSLSHASFKVMEQALVFVNFFKNRNLFNCSNNFTSLALNKNFSSNLFFYFSTDNAPLPPLTYQLQVCT